MRVLVTGGAGFIGGHVVEALLSRGVEVVVLDSLIPQVHGPGASWPEWLRAAGQRSPGRLTTHQGDIRDRAALQAAMLGVTHLVHLAAEVGVGQGQYEIERYVDTNVRGTAMVLEEAVKAGVQRIFVAGSMSAYGEGPVTCPTHGQLSGLTRQPEDLRAGCWPVRCPQCPAEAPAGTLPYPVTEDEPLRPAGVYARTKADTEGYALDVGKAYGIPVFVGRFFNVYGPRQSLRNPYTGIAAIFTSAWLAGGRPMIFEDGDQMRDFISVHDVASAVELLILDAPADKAGVYNVATGSPSSVAKIADLIRTTLQEETKRPKPSPLFPERFRSGDIRGCYGDSLRLRLLGWLPRVQLKDGIRELVRESLKSEAAKTAVADHAQADRELTSRGLS